MSYPKMKVIFFNEGDQWIAQAIERDFCANGPTIEDAERELLMSIMARVALGERMGFDAFETLPPAPSQYRRMWEGQGRPLVLDTDAALSMTDENGLSFKPTHLEFEGRVA